MPSPAAIDFWELCDIAQQPVERHYGIRVVTREIPKPLVGDLNGIEIHIDTGASPEQRLFLLAHLFGHTVQWNTSPTAFEIGQARRPPVAESLMPTLIAYEREAGAFGMALLHEAGIRVVDQWISDYSACDLAYLAHYYRTGEKRDPMSFWKSGTPLIQPLPIPEFQPRRLVFRSDGIVI